MGCFKIVLFVGIDPGTTVAYAVVDSNSRKTTLYSQKEMSADILIQKLSNLKNISVIATDKKKIPSFVKTIAVKIGSTIYHPKEDMKISEKVSLTKTIKYSNSHERDALACALIAMDSYKQKIIDINNFLKSNGRSHLSENFTHQAIKNPLFSYHEILKKFEKKDNVEKKKEIKVQSPPKLDEKSVLIRRLLKENKLLTKQNRLLQQDIKNLKNALGKYSPIKDKKHKTDLDKQLMSILSLKEKRLHNMELKGKASEKKNNELRKQIERLIKYMIDQEKHLFLRSIQDLRSFSEEKKIIFVDNINIYTINSIKNISENNILISPVKATSKLRKQLQCTIIEWKNLFFEKIDSLVVIKKKNFEEKLNKIDNINDIISDYKEKRKQELLQ